VIARSLPPVPRVDVALSLPGGAVDLGARVLVAGVVPAPRFGREGEVAATAAAVAAGGADLVDVSLPPRLVGPVARAGGVPVVARAGSLAEAAAAGRAGAAAVLVPAVMLAGDGPVTGIDLADADLGGAAVVVVVDDLPDVAAARAVAEAQGVPLAFDSTTRSPVEATAQEAAAVALGCRVIRTGDVRRSRRVAEVMGAVLAARRPPGALPAGDLASTDGIPPTDGAAPGAAPPIDDHEAPA
jgi:hypothetical protein